MANRTSYEEVGKELSGHFRRKGLTQMEVAKIYGVAQSWVARIYAGRFTMRSKAACRMCKDANILLHNMTEHESTKENLKLINLLAEVWDGSAEDASFLVDALRLLRKLKHRNLQLGE